MVKSLKKHAEVTKKLVKEGWMRIGCMEQVDLKSEQFGGVWVKDGKTFYLNYITMNQI